MKNRAFFMLVGMLVGSCSLFGGADSPVGADPANENKQYNICSPPNHPAFRKNGVYRKEASGLWYTHVINKTEAPVSYRSNYTCTCALWNPVLLSQCLNYVPSQRPAHANDYPACTSGGGTCRYYIGTDADHSGYVLVGPQDGI